MKIARYALHRARAAAAGKPMSILISVLILPWEGETMVPWEARARTQATLTTGCSDSHRCPTLKRVSSHAIFDDMTMETLHFSASETNSYSTTPPWSGDGEKGCHLERRGQVYTTDCIWDTWVTILALHLMPACQPNLDESPDSSSVAPLVQ